MEEQAALFRVSRKLIKKNDVQEKVLKSRGVQRKHRSVPVMTAN